VSPLIKFLLSSPPGGGTPNLPSQIDAAANELGTYYGRMQHRWQVQDPVAEHVLKEQDARMGWVAELPHLLDTVPVPPPQPEPAQVTDVTTPRWASEDAIAAASKSLDTVAPPGKLELIREGRVEVAVQLGRSIREAASSFLQPVAHAIPLGGPLLEAISGLADQNIEERIRAASSPTAAELLRDPARPSAVVGDAANVIAGRVQVANAGAVDQAARARLSEAEQSLRSLGSARHDLDVRVTDVQVGRLVSGTQRQAEETSSALGARGNVITRSQVQQLISIMRDGTESWAGPPYVPWPGSHCTCWEHTSVSYYAAQALEDVGSPLVSDAVLNEASNVPDVTYSKVTDPGWVCSVNGSSTVDAICSQGGGSGGMAVSALPFGRVRCVPISG
jgi:hypothetical protein